MTSPTLCLIGAGRAGGSLARQWQRCGGLALSAVHGGRGAGALAADIGAASALELADLPASDALLIATGDGAIAAVAAELAALSGRDWHNTVVFHLSGALSAQALQPLAALGAHVASAHPVRAFSSDGAPFDPTWVGLEGDPRALALLEPAFAAIGGRCFRVDGDTKTHYHAAAVVASNHLVALADASQRLWHEAGVDAETGRALFESLVSGVLENLREAPPAQALTGPVARGDADTLRRHRRQLAQTAPDIATLYTHLSRYLGELMRQRQGPETHEALAAALADPPEEPTDKP